MFFCGNCRTFIEYIDSCYQHIISNIVSPEEYNIYLYFYLKLTDPGPKGQGGWDFSYPDVDEAKLCAKLAEMNQIYPHLKIDSKILHTNEISDEELLSQIKCREKYTGFYSEDSKLLRGMHCHYNFEKCGEYILQKEKELNLQFDVLIYIRPDLYFTSACLSINNYSKTLVTLAEGFGINNDQFAIIPHDHLKAFFFDRIKIYRENVSNIFTIAEEIYWHTIPYEIKSIGNYSIKRHM